MASQQYAQWIPMHPPSTEYEGSAYKSGYTEVVDYEVTPKRRQSFKQKYFGSGITRTLRAFLTVACLVLFINVVWLFIAKSKYGIENGFGTIKEGNCSDVKGLNTWFHLAINILSTLLLTGSNAFMAAFSCPSRPEVNEAHRRGEFLHVGPLSLRNLRRIAKRKGLVVVILGLSSIPFHLMYNSLVFEDLAVNQYYWSVVTEDFMTGAPFNLTGDWSYYSDGIPYISYDATPPNANLGGKYASGTDNILRQSQAMNDYFGDIQKNASSWQRLENKDCINAYSNAFLSGRRNVVLVSSQKNDTNSIMMYGSSDIENDYTGNWWICSGGTGSGPSATCIPDTYAASASNWSVYNYPVEYCLSQQVEDTCSVRFSLTIMYVVIAFNAIKVVFMIWVLCRYDAEHILTSVGDAASSFLQDEDHTTVQMCLANKRQMRDFWQARGFPRPFSRIPPRWGEAVSRKRWILFFFLMAGSFFFVVIFGLWGFIHTKNRGVSLSPASLWRLGFGAINQNTMAIADNGASPIVLAIVANIPQIFLSTVYMMYMGIMSSMFLAADWSTFAFKSQTLLVSSPVGRQRGTWLLGAPIGWGLALLTLQLLLHWFVSQSLFLVQMTTFDKDGTPLPSSEQYATISNCGYSPIAIIFSIVAAGILLFSAIFFCWRKFPEGAPPVVSTCSAAISAACHPIYRSEELPYGDLRWGVDSSYPNGIGHCSLMAAEKWDMGIISTPIHNYMYT